ncbi:MAG: LAGLIDADG family homing endonuclease [Promethearchaeota archaeon]
MDKHEYYEENDENIKRDSSINKKDEKNLDVLDKLSDNKLSPHKIEIDLINNGFTPNDEEDLINDMNFESNYEPLEEKVIGNKIRFTDEDLKSKRILRYHPNLNISYFKQIDTQKKAYWLGFLFADGFIKTNKGEPYRVGIDAGNKDFWIINRFIKDIGLNPKYIQNLKNRFRISFSSKEIIRDLIRNGLIPGKEKSNNIEFPQLKTKELKLAFLLGYFDGDGTQKTSKITSGSKLFLEQIKNKFSLGHKIETVRSGGPIYGREVDGIAYRLALGSDLFNEMLDNYKDSLPRKRNRFKTEEERIESIKENAWHGSHKRKFIIKQQELEKLVDLMPLYKIGEKFNVSGKTVKKYCMKWGIKTPTQGSWIKRKK